MKKIVIISLFIGCICTIAFAQTDSITAYKKKSAMIPMRDGVKLFTLILSPVDATKPVPILIQRTPYGANIPIPDDTTIEATIMGNFIMAKEGYIFVYQDIRGKSKSEGTMQIHM
ncbi:MAG: X-Pro dipeptidyl-peptidase, partial [Bacteroidota bacterium]|nr:X-Pro dipeptidyl-peptidase [Bacteroidota bacterium]